MSRKMEASNEIARIRRALGELTEGGVVEAAAWIGSSALPNAATGETIDIAISVWPSDLSTGSLKVLKSIGYARSDSQSISGLTALTHESGKVILWAMEAGSERWTDCLLQRDWLTANATERDRYRESLSAIEKVSDLDDRKPARDALMARSIAQARQWSVETRGFSPLIRGLEVLQDLQVGWCVCSGWALDLFLNRPTRVHHDIDISISRADQLIVQRYLLDRGWKWVTPINDELKPWPEGQRLELPNHQAHSHYLESGIMLDFLFSEIEGDMWRFRRNLEIIRPLSRAFLVSESGFPILAPEIVLLFKSRPIDSGGRLKDHDDFAMVSEYLDDERRAWLSEALRNQYGEHEWVNILKRADSDSHIKV